MGQPGWPGAAAVVAILLALGLGPGVVEAERAEKDGVIVSLNGHVAPLELPRKRAVPVGVHLDGEVRTADGSPLPRLDGLRLELAGSGRLSTRGLPRCPGARLRNADSHQALHRCGKALVGTGLMRAEVFIPGQASFALRGHLLAFNGTMGHGRQALWVHVFSFSPPISLAVPFSIASGEGGFRTTLVASLPEWTGPYPHLASFELTLSRRFQYQGEIRSYARASCPIPPRFTAGFLAFARARYRFQDRRQVSVESVRSCRAAGGRGE